MGGKMLRFKKFLLFFSLIFSLLVFLFPQAWSSEGGSSHYTPGAMASFIDFPSGIPYNVVSPMFGYVGSASASREFPLAGLVTAGLDANLFAWTPVFQYDLPKKVLGGQYAFTIVLPLVDLNVDANVIGPTGASVRRSQTKTGLGDIYFSPFNLFWKKGNFKILSSVAMYVPSGGYTVGDLANLGKNYWTFNPYGGFSYNNLKTGLEANAYLGFNFNTKNTATDYLSGHEIYLDFTVNKRWKNGFGVGGTGFVFQQITGDSGSGARLGEFRGRTIGLGPEFSYVTPLPNKVLFAMEAKYMPEIEVKNRLQGHWIWFKFAFIFK